MPIEHSNALVIKSVDFSETSLILTLFTRDFGKIHGIAKGGRRLKNPYESALDLLTQINVSFICKHSESLDLLTEAKLIRRFRPGWESAAGLYAGYYLMELLNLTTVDYAPAPELFDLAIESLRRFEKKGEINAAMFLFEWQLLRLLGEEPSVRYCIECQRDIHPEELIYTKQRLTFALLDGGLVCPECRKTRRYRQIASLSPEAVILLDAIADGRIETVAACPGRVWKEVRGLMNHYITQIAGRRPVMLDYINVITGMN